MIDPSWQTFLDYLDEPSDLEYGDFKRRTDSHLRRLVETSPPLSEEQARRLVELRARLIWQDHPDEDIYPIKERIRKEILEIAPYH